MRRITLALLLSALATAQAIIPTIDPDEATQHLTKRIIPSYPSLAELARIQGNVILDIEIDELGKPENITVVQGHPMLVQAAIDAVSRARYAPFEVNGKNSVVRTVVAVTFGRMDKANDISARAALYTQLGKASFSAGDFAKAEQNLNKALDLMTSLQHEKSVDPNEWLAGMGRLHTVLAKVAIAASDFAQAEQNLNMASTELASVKHAQPADQEELQATMGRLNMSEKKYSEAENNLKQALNLAQQNAASSPDVAQRQGWLSQLYTQENKYDQARLYGDQEIDTCEKFFNKSGVIPQVNQLLGSEIAYRSWMLTTLALLQNDHEEAIKRCHVVMDHQTYLDSSYRDQAMATCQKELDHTHN